MELIYFKKEVEEQRRKQLRLEDVALSKIPAVKAPTNLTLAVHLHLFYADMIDYLKNFLEHIPQSFTLFISVPDTALVDEEDIEREFHGLSRVETIKICRTPNRGRDIAPMLCTFKEDLQHYDVLLHIHSKKSPHLDNPTEWTDLIFSHLLPSEEGVRKILSLFQGNTGMVAPPPFHFVEDSGWGVGNKSICQALLDKANTAIIIDRDYPTIDFPQSSMFFATPEYLSTLFSLNLTYEDFPHEPIGVDGTLAHAIERLFFLFGALKGKDAKRIYRSSVEIEMQGRIQSILEKLYIANFKNEKHLRLLQKMNVVSIVLLVLLLASLLVHFL